MPGYGVDYSGLRNRRAAER